MAATRQTPAAARTEQRIYATSIRLMSERGYHGTSLRDIARASEVQIASIYYYFDSKQALLLRIMSQTMRELTAAVAAAIGEATSPAERLRAGLRAHLAFHADRALEAFLTDSEIRALEPASRQTIVAARDAYEQMFHAILREGVAAGDFSVPDVKVMTFGMMATCTAVAGWFRPGGRLGIDTISDAYADLFLHGISTSGRAT